MPTEINGITYYHTLEACRLAGISRATLFRWLSQGTIEDSTLRDRRGWRIFNDSDIDRIRQEVNRLLG